MCTPKISVCSLFGGDVAVYGAANCGTIGDHYKFDAIRAQISFSLSFAVLLCGVIVCIVYVDYVRRASTWSIVEINNNMMITFNFN